MLIVLFNTATKCACDSHYNQQGPIQFHCNASSELDGKLAFRFEVTSADRIGHSFEVVVLAASVPQASLGSLKIVAILVA